MLQYLAGLKFVGRIVLISGAFTVALDHVSRIGTRLGLDIAGVLKKPFRYWELQDLLSRLLAPAEAESSAEPDLAHDVTLRDALQNNWVEFWYQPKVDLVTGRLAGVEALMRLRHPEHGMLRPGRLFEQAAREDMADLLVRSLDDAVRNSPRLRRDGRRLSVSINVAGCTLIEPELLDRLREHRADLDPQVNVILEVTETDIVEDQSAAESFVTRALLHGFDVSIDDFGHGYATFDRLRRMPFTDSSSSARWSMAAPPTGPSRTSAARVRVSAMILVPRSLRKASSARTICAWSVHSASTWRRASCSRARCRSTSSSPCPTCSAIRRWPSMADSDAATSLPDYAARATHDLNNLLMVIIGHADLLGETLPAGSDAKDSASEILEAALKAQDLSNKLLAEARAARARNG